MIFSLRSAANHTVEHVYSNVLKSNCEADLHRAQRTKFVYACARAYVSVCTHVYVSVCARVCVCAVCLCVFNCSLPTNFFSLHPLLLVYIFSIEVCRLPQTHPKRQLSAESGKHAQAAVARATRMVRDVQYFSRTEHTEHTH